MVKTFKHYKDEFMSIREDLKSAKSFDPKLVASWLSKTLATLEKMADNLDLLAQEVETIQEKIEEA